MAGGCGTLILGTIGAMLVATFYAIAGMFINYVSDAPCSLDNLNDRLLRSKNGIPEDLIYCTQIPSYMKVPLIATHLLAFALFPFAMHVFWVRAPQLQQMKARNPFSSILGFAFLMVAIAGEIGWHVGQQWFYQEEYHVLNFIFYFFFMLGIAFWANGIKENKLPAEQKSWLDMVIEALLLLSPLVVTLVYAAAATIKTICPGAAICSVLEPSKVPIYILMAVEFAVLSIRLYKLLDNDWRVVFVPFFSVGINLLCIFLLNANQKDVILNPLFHILHDLAGTELGVFIATLLVWTKTSPVSEKSRSE
ncbi:hypothetical protein R1sor_013710 [Riccia sorocarpa]|uniref:Uncharacterized protein n=1 Tax=Riccia sorocarpa TaxID=122646 RepID=A0ABD3HBG1_9MARC